MRFFLPLLITLWNTWDLQVSILISLCLQILLVFTGSLRKHIVWKWLKSILWLAYLLADSVAIFALGVLANNNKKNETPNQHNHHNNNNDDKNENQKLLAFWAPFLLLHLGGPDNITAFSIEDNELWLRHLLNLVFQVLLAMYVFIGSLPNTNLLFPALLMFLVGITKYAERSLALMLASMDRVRTSVTSDSRSSQSVYLKKDASVQLENLAQQILRRPCDNLDDDLEAKVLKDAYEFSQTFKCLIVDYFISTDEKVKSLKTLSRLKPMQAFKLVEIELNFLYEIFYTKSAVIHTVAGCLLRLITLFSILSAVVLFIFFTKKDGYQEIDVVITHILLIAALILECYAVGLLVFSEWTFLKLKNMFLANIIASTIYFFRPPNRPRWSNTMTQYNLITLCLKKLKLSWLTRALEIIHLKEAWDNFWSMRRVPVNDNMRKFIFNELKTRAMDTETIRQQNVKNFRGQWALQKMSCYEEFKWSIEDMEFEDSVLVWHIATNLCYHNTIPNNLKELTNYRTMCQELSDYMLYLLVLQPLLVSSTKAHMSFKNCCVDATINITRDKENITRQILSGKKKTWKN